MYGSNFHFKMSVQYLFSLLYSNNCRFGNVDIPSTGLVFLVIVIIRCISAAACMGANNIEEVGAVVQSEMQHLESEWA